MKLAIVGSRHFDDYDLMKEFIISKFDITQIDTIVSGGAKGADTLAEKFAKENNLLLIVKKAEWNKYGRAAGPKRNELIISEADWVAAFPSKNSKGTLNSMKLARQEGKRLEVLNV
jgi:predicted Rossmann fold nucleotide-binding protein DprA/Smf involved in DNA uptake